MLKLLIEDVCTGRERDDRVCAIVVDLHKRCAIREVDASSGGVAVGLVTVVAPHDVIITAFGWGGWGVQLQLHSVKPLRDVVELILY